MSPYQGTLPLHLQRVVGIVVIAHNFPFETMEVDVYYGVFSILAIMVGGYWVIGVFCLFVGFSFLRVALSCNVP